MRLATAVRPAYGCKIWPDRPLRQASHFPVFDQLSTGLKYFAQSMHVLSVAASEQHGMRTLAPHT